MREVGVWNKSSGQEGRPYSEALQQGPGAVGDSREQLDGCGKRPPQCMQADERS